MVLLTKAAPARTQLMQIRRTIHLTAAGKQRSGFTLTEVVVSFVIAALTVGGIITSYLMAAQRSEWTTASTAAHQMAMDRMAQLRDARWELSWEVPGSIMTNELRPGTNWDAPSVLDVPRTGTGELWATNLVTVTRLSPPPVCVLRVDCVWSLLTRGPFTNTVVSYRAPDQ